MRPVAAALLNLLSPWWAAQRGVYSGNEALAELVQLATRQDVHVMQFLANPVLPRLGCTSSADLCAALEALYALHVVQQGRDAFHVRLAAADHVQVVFLEHAVEHACDALELAESVTSLVDAPHVYAVVSPTATPMQVELPRRPIRDALVCLDAASAEELLLRYGWTYKSRPFGPSARCMTWDQFEQRRAEYEAWRQELVRQNIQATRAAQHDHTDYPQHTIVAVMTAQSVAVDALKSRLAAVAPNAIDYVDAQNPSVIYVRCASAAAAASVAQSLGPPSYVLQGAEQAAYWAQVPQRVRHAAMRRSLKYTRAD